MTDKFIKILLSVSVIFAILTAEEHGAGEHSETPEAATADDEKAGQKESDKSTYLEKLKSRYVSRLPYLMIPVMIVPVIKKGELIGYLTVMPQLKGNGVESYRKLQAEIIKIKDEIFCDLFYAMSRLWIGPEPPLATAIEGRIKKRLRHFFKEELIERVNLHFMKFSIFKTKFIAEHEYFKADR